MPNLKIGTNVRVAPGPSEIAARRGSHPEPPEKSEEHDQPVGDTSIGTAPRFRGSLDMVTPSRHGHSHAHSSSVDFTSPNFANAMVSTPHAGIRNHIKHKASFSLPTINPADFTDIRRSFDDCGERDDASQGGNDTMGIDLPPVPASYINKADLSRVSEKDEGNESSLLRQTIDEIAPAFLALSSSPKTSGNSADTSSRMDLADLAPIIFHGDHLQASISSSIRSEEEHMAEEMERVMAMDTPTRAEFVISPPPSSYAASHTGGRDSRASVRTVRSMSSVGSVPPMPVRTPTGWASTLGAEARYTPRYAEQAEEYDADQSRFIDADEEHPHYASIQDLSLGLSEFRQPLSHAMSMPTLSHPHPPPLPILPGPINFSRPVIPPILRPHTPIAAANLRNTSKKSTETISTTYTQHTPVSVYDHDQGETPEQFHLSQREKERIQRLKERAQAAVPALPRERGRPEGKRSKSAMGHREREKQKEREVQGKPKSALKPLQQAEKKSNRMSVPILGSAKKAPVYKDRVEDECTEGKMSKGSVAERRGKSGKLSTISTGSGKENARVGGKGSKLSSGSGPAAGPRGLRA